MSCQCSNNDENIHRVTLRLDERVAAALAGVAEVAGRAVKIGHASLGCKSMIENFIFCTGVLSPEHEILK